MSGGPTGAFTMVASKGMALAPITPGILNQGKRSMYQGTITAGRDSADVKLH